MRVDVDAMLCVAAAAASTISFYLSTVHCLPNQSVHPSNPHCGCDPCKARLNDDRISVTDMGSHQDYNHSPRVRALKFSKTFLG